MRITLSLYNNVLKRTSQDSNRNRIHTKVKCLDYYTEVNCVCVHHYTEVNCVFVCDLDQGVQPG